MRGHTKALTCCLSVMLVLFLSGGLARADSQQHSAETTQSEEKKAKKKKWPWAEAGIEIRFRNEWRDNFDFQPPDDADSFLGQRIRGHVLFKLREKLDFYLQGQDVWLYGAERDKIIHDLGTNLHQVYFDWTIAPANKVKLRVGRQEFNFGRQRLVGGFGWDNVSRSFDGFDLSFGAASWTPHVFAGRLVEVRRRGGLRRPGNLHIGGAYLAHAPTRAAGQTEVYGLFLRDSLRTSGELGLTPDTARILTGGFRRLYAPATGFRYEVENAWQFGERGPDRHTSVMLVGNAGYVWDTPRKPLVQFEYAFARGDDDPTDGDSNEFHNLFPTNHIHYGYADLVGLRNLHNFRVTGAAQVRPKVRVEVDYHRFLLAAIRGPWKSAGGAVLGWDPTGSSGRDIGQELDLTVRLPLKKRLSFLAGYSVFLPGAFAKRTRGPETHHFGYIQTMLRF